jgi:flagellar hook-basal body complex protein FliE
MTIPAIGAISSALPSLPSLPTSPVSGADTSTSSLGSSAASSSSGSDFASMLQKGLDSVQGAQTNADNLAVQAATGDLTDISQYTIAASQASLMTELATTLSTKGVAALNQIMGMQA